MNDSKYIANGFLVTAPPTSKSYKYLGVDNNSWPAEVGTQYAALRAVLNGAYAKSENTPILLNIKLTRTYKRICVLSDTPARLLYCEAYSDYEGNYDPNLHRQFAIQSNFLGYDLAYPNGDYYSAVLNDLIGRKEPFICQCILNENGLIESLSTAFEFALKRKQVQAQLDRIGQGFLLEGDTFCIFGVYSVPKDLANSMHL